MRKEFQRSASSECVQKQKLKQLRNEVKAGIDAIERGEYVDVEAKDIGAYIATLAPKSRKAK